MLCKSSLMGQWAGVGLKPRLRHGPTSCHQLPQPWCTGSHTASPSCPHPMTTAMLCCQKGPGPEQGKGWVLAPRSISGQGDSGCLLMPFPTPGPGSPVAWLVTRGLILAEVIQILGSRYKESPSLEGQDPWSEHLPESGLWAGLLLPDSVQSKHQSQGPHRLSQAGVCVPLWPA